MQKQELYKQELDKLAEIFQEVEPSKAKLVEGLIQDAAFLRVENFGLRQAMEKTGMIKVHPQNPEVQKSTEAAKQYLKNVNSYAVIIKTLNGVLSKNILDPDDDDLSDFE